MPLIFMSHRIKDKRPDGPVIVVQSDGKQVHADKVLIYDNNGDVLGQVVFDMKPNAKIKTHEVRAWIEVFDKDNVGFEL